MPDTRKIALMTKAALCEQKGYKQSLRITSYTKKDYLILHGIGAWVCVTIAYGLVVLLWLLYVAASHFGTYLLNQITGFAIVLLSIYGVVCAIDLVSAIHLYGRRYDQAEKLVAEYAHWLSEIQQSAKR